ncbi:hypothetical protein [Citreimonas salinaria]|uniref:Uncharacterized protein n=1 Tax=Citreimonas salinaria TaxID=321339 RepID=A0A1H3NKR6_9RHOB|nr:hypothetical protein [Citreimonas salinaria]SDY88809.1 hypothetical protein SAMN05444340_1254 [Citreimonas salinaria]
MFINLSEFEDTPEQQLSQKRHARQGSFEIDTENYQALLDDPSLDPEFRRQFLEALWSIIVSLVELGFGVHPADTIENTTPQADNFTELGG